MNLKTWLKSQERGTRAKMERALGPSAQSVGRSMRGTPITHRIAEKISAMTDGAVSIAELCDPTTTQKRSKRRATKARKVAS